MTETDEVFSIGAAARAAGNLSIDTLRSYERRGLLTPRRDSTGRRIYGPHDVARAKAIHAELKAGRLRGPRSG